MTKADVIVVGAGPAGASAAFSLARSGADVILLEEHDEVGVPNHCAGLVSPRTLEAAEVDATFQILASYTGAKVWGPLGSRAQLESERLQALAIDRTALDRHLVARAERAGARLWRGVRAHGFERTGSRVRITASNGHGPKRIEAPIVIGADGVHSQVARWLNGHETPAVVPVIKADIRFKTPEASPDMIQIMVGNDLAPGWFAWLIPLPGGEARIGLGSMTRDIKRRYRRFARRIRDEFGAFEVLKQRGWLIPAQPRRQIAFDNGVLVGDAARQAKPSSGGGIFMGLQAGALAADAVTQALDGGGPLRPALDRYQARWVEQEGDELHYSHWLRTIYNRLDDEEIDQLVALCNRPWARIVISRLGDIDFSSWLFRPVHQALETLHPGLLKGLGDRLHQSSPPSLAGDLEQLDLDPESLLKLAGE